MLVAIGSEVDVPVPLTNDRRAVDTALQALDPWGSTALHDAVVTAFDAIEPAPGRRALVIVSDGLERGSRRSAADVLARVRASDVLAYPVVLQGKVPEVLAQLAVTTGGQAQRVKRLSDVPAVLRRIAVGPASSVPARVPAGATARRWRIPAHRGPGGAAEASCPCARGLSRSLSRPDTGLWRLTVEMPSLPGGSALHVPRWAAASGSPYHARVAASARVLTE